MIADVYEYLHCYAADCITRVFHPHGTHALEHPEERHIIDALAHGDESARKGKLHTRIPNHFGGGEDVEVFRPERWVQGGGRKEGGRFLPCEAWARGENLSVVEMRLRLGMVPSMFETVVVNEGDDGPLELEETVLTLRIKKMGYRLRFVPLSG